MNSNISSNGDKLVLEKLGSAGGYLQRKDRFKAHC